MDEETTTAVAEPEEWVHDPQRDGAGCGWCGAYAQVNAEGLCRGCH